MPMGRVTCPVLWAAALGPPQPCGVSLTTGGIAPASLRYDRLTPVARVAGPHCLAGGPLLGFVPALLSSVASMTPRNVCHGSDAAWLRSDQWPWSTSPATAPAGWLGCLSASDRGGVDRCVLSLCCPWCVCVCGVLAHLGPVYRCARPLCVVRGVQGHVALVHPYARCVLHACAGGGFVPPAPPPFFLRALYLVSFVFCLNGKGGASTLQAQAWATDAAVQ